MSSAKVSPIDGQRQLQMIWGPAALVLAVASMLVLIIGAAALASDRPSNGSAAARTASLPAPVGGVVWAWGANEYGQLGDQSFIMTLSKTRVHDVAGATAVVGGASHSLALLEDGSVWAWGWNKYGQFGAGAHRSRSEAVQVP